MDGITDYLWQRRIQHGVRYQKSSVPFPESVRLGMEFNAALEKKETLDLSLLTNAVMLELCDFARCVSKSEAHFLFEILEFNFDLGVDGLNQVQYMSFKRRVHSRAKMTMVQLKSKPDRWKEPFSLPDLIDERALPESEQWEIRESKTFDTSVLTAGSKNSQSSEKTKSDGNVLVMKFGRVLIKLTDESFPNCQESGVSLIIRPENRPKERLQPEQLTKGILIELLEFSKVICGTQTGIVFDLVKLNFGHELNKTLYRLRVNKITERKYASQSAEEKEALLKEPFLSQSKNPRKNSKRRKNRDMDYLELENLIVPGKRRSILRDRESNETEIWLDSDLSYMCPVDSDAEMLSDVEAEPEKSISESFLVETLEKTMSSARAEESTNAEAGAGATFTLLAETSVVGESSATDESMAAEETSGTVEETRAATEETSAAGKKISASVNPSSSMEENPSAITEETLSVVIKEEEEEVFVSSVQSQLEAFDSQPDNTSLKTVSDLFSKDQNQDLDVKTPKQRLWVRRATRSKQILRSYRVNDIFASCKAIGLDFNVGSGNKQKLSLQLFTNSVMLGVLKFASAMKKSIHSLLCEILENNFNINLGDSLQKRYLTVYLMSKERSFQNHPARHTMAFLSSPCKLHNCFNMVDVTGDFQTGEEFEDRQGNPDSGASETAPFEDSDPYPFCRKIGLDLWSTDERPASQKLDLVDLTKGAAIEMFGYIRELCGNIHETVNDVLAHNFDLDLRNPETDDAKAIQKWYTKQKVVMTQHYRNKHKLQKWLEMLVPLNVRSQPHQQPTSRKSPEKQDAQDSASGRKPPAVKENVAKGKGGYRLCKNIDLDLFVDTKTKPKRKMNLGVLTRGVLVEIHQYVMRNSNRYIPTLYQILEFNFDLSSQNHRKVEFAWDIATQVLRIAGNVSRKGNYLDKVVELPFELRESSQIVCKEEPEHGYTEQDFSENSDVVFVRELKPVDIEVEIQ
ncbi:uncharacterized protein LOC117812601 [Xyrichtys novacula]|uniref:Uncharacterized protein LOC117812601 n=1 Tax=Xyrichtys novacula TaxID=13765 RepID=A0AAV1FQL0_XYRNO|nr:uncharacterized protein LOC117812601 [Xyrichtys novacula]